jgi:hypothetical protein
MRSPGFAPSPHGEFAFLEDDDAAGSRNAFLRLLSPRAARDIGLVEKRNVAGKRLHAFASEPLASRLATPPETYVDFVGGQKKMPYSFEQMRLGGPHNRHFRR